LLPVELNCLCAFGGSAFKKEFESRLPSDPADVAATLLKLLGVGGLEGLDGRVLNECLKDGGEEGLAEPRTEILSASRGDFSQRLQRTHWRGRAYLDEGFREP
jgi:hypothetical protein